MRLMWKRCLNVIYQYWGAQVIFTVNNLSRYLDSSGRFRHKRKALSRWNISYARNNLAANLFDIHQTLQKEMQNMDQVTYSFAF